MHDYPGNLVPTVPVLPEVPERFTRHMLKLYPFQGIERLEPLRDQPLRRFLSIHCQPSDCIGFPPRDRYRALRHEVRNNIPALLELCGGTAIADGYRLVTNIVTNGPHP